MSSLSHTKQHDEDDEDDVGVHGIDDDAVVTAAADDEADADVDAFLFFRKLATVSLCGLTLFPLFEDGGGVALGVGGSACGGGGGVAVAVGVIGNVSADLSVS